MNEAGDRREAGRRWDAAESQPISMTERALVARIYALFDCFYDQLSEEHEQMRRARMLRARRPDEQSRTAPTGNINVSKTGLVSVSTPSTKSFQPLSYGILVNMVLYPSE